MSVSNLRLGVLVMLKTVINNFAAHFGIKCSSLCRVNKGTSMRSACSSEGYVGHVSVLISNKLLDRTRWFLKFCSYFGWENSVLSPPVFPALSLACATLLRRTCALVLLCTALGGAWSLEQPSGSLLEYFPTWTYVMRKIFDNGGPQAATSSFGFKMPSIIKNGCQKHLCVHTFKLHM